MKAKITARYLTEVQVAELTGRALSTLRNDRSIGRGVPYIKIGRSVRYDLGDVIRFMDAHKIITQCDMPQESFDSCPAKFAEEDAVYCELCVGNQDRKRPL